MASIAAEAAVWRQIKFTCNLCGTTNIRPVNPHAWTKGSVFGRCGGCNVIHKVAHRPYRLIPTMTHTLTVSVSPEFCKRAYFTELLVLFVCHRVADRP